MQVCPVPLGSPVPLELPGSALSRAIATKYTLQTRAICCSEGFTSLGPFMSMFRVISIQVHLMEKVYSVQPGGPMTSKEFQGSEEPLLLEPRSW